MSGGRWADRPLLGFDLETTGTDVENDRIVTACVVRVGVGGLPVKRLWLSDVAGMEIPAAAAALHGIPTEVAREAGRPAAEVIEEIVNTVEDAAEDGLPLVAMNAAFDLTVLDREARRHGVVPLVDRLFRPSVIDPRVLDRRLDRWRRGQRTLTDLCAHYGVQLSAAHSADADARAAVEVTRAIADRYSWISRYSPAQLHREQEGWAREQQDGLRSYFARTPGKEHLAAGVRSEWPMVPWPGEAAA